MSSRFVVKRSGNWPNSRMSEIPAMKKFRGFILLASCLSFLKIHILFVKSEMIIAKIGSVNIFPSDLKPKS